MFALSYDSSREIAAGKLIAKFGFVVDFCILPRLHLGVDKLELLTADFKPLVIDFNAKTYQRRLQDKRHQGLVKACRPGVGVKIVDVTAGLGRDGFLLANCGADVVFVERSPVIAALLDDALQRFVLSNENFGSMQLVWEYGQEYLKRQSRGVIDVVYLDPMHPQRSKSALVKKDMQILQGLLGASDDAEDLLCVARSSAKKAVVKWPQKQQPLQKAQYSINGTTVRFDVYVED